MPLRDLNQARRDRFVLEVDDSPEFGSDRPSADHTVPPSRLWHIYGIFLAWHEYG